MILLTAFCPYHIGHFIIIGLKFDDLVRFHIDICSLREMCPVFQIRKINLSILVCSSYLSSIPLHFR